ncbi:hypothetical protein P691DRAFT_776880 [Macrolepiota fuliginosa MF-IS2]|uniref:Uncharacterized protein n=1 Tax=Macrolepiota fuliginosa MF-IS2 TaxID=1400762 RepID=A0A9P6C0B4_9AGAR|nr:hypothetical protein P691DRAFT_776880 [Macrolepiota fuliginosa MF-IS2]
MGNSSSSRASYASHSTHSSTLTLVASPGVTISRDDVVLLLLGPVGAETTLFGKLVTHTKTSASESLCGPTHFSEDNVQFYETAAPGSGKRVVLIIPPSLDGDKITEEIVIQGVIAQLFILEIAAIKTILTSIMSSTSVKLPAATIFHLRGF